MPSDRAARDKAARGGTRSLGKDSHKGTKARRETHDRCLHGIADPTSTIGALFQQRLPEIDEETEPEIEQSDIGENLFTVNGSQFFDGLKLDENAAVDDEVGAKAFVESHSVIADGDWLLPLHLVCPPLLLTREDNFIYGLQ
jgi:hypothetical protein